jgi:predicted transcriptional regulator
MATDTRRTLHALVDSIDEQNLDAAQAFLEFLAARRGKLMPLEESDPGSVETRDAIEDPLLREFLAAPEDDEDLSDEDSAAIEEGKADVAAGRIVTHEEIMRRWPPRS